MIKLFVVDDDPLVGETMQYILKKNRQDVEYIGQAFSGNKGLGMVRDYIPDVTFVDIKMPTMNGFTLTKQFKKVLPSMKVVFFTAFDDYDYRQKALRLGASDYLCKPFNRQEFLAVIDKLRAELNSVHSPATLKNTSVVPTPEFQELTAYIRAGETQNACMLLNKIWQELIVVSNKDTVLIRTRSAEIAKAILLLLEEIKISSDAIPLSYQSFINKISLRQSIGFTEICLREFVTNASNMFNQYMNETWCKQILRIKESIELNLHTNITLEMISNNIYLSPFYLCHLFKERTGTTLMDYVTERRIEKAKLLLSTSNEKVESIAMKVGYNNANSFSRMFKKRTGISPSEYRLSELKY